MQPTKNSPALFKIQKLLELTVHMSVHWIVIKLLTPNQNHESKRSPQMVNSVKSHIW